MLLSLVTTSGTVPAAAIPSVPGDGLSGTWQVSRVCLTICVSPPPVLKLVRHWHDEVFVTAGPTSQVLYRVGLQVVVHGPKDSLSLTVRARGLLMSGFGVGADGSTFQTTWRCVAAPPTAASAPGASQANASFSSPAQVPAAKTVC
jgi:hypothetical protein